MHTLKYSVLALLPLCLAVSCALSPPTPALQPKAPEGQKGAWVGSLNSRGGSAHDGEWLFSFVQTGEALAGEYSHPGDGCLKAGSASGTVKGRELLAVVVDSTNRLEISATTEGGGFYGVYRFTIGPCAGDWGSIAGVTKTGGSRQ